MNPVKAGLLRVSSSIRIVFVLWRTVKRSCDKASAGLKAPRKLMLERYAARTKAVPLLQRQ